MTDPEKYIILAESMDLCLFSGDPLIITSRHTLDAHWAATLVLVVQWKTVLSRSQFPGD